ncbi:MAG: hypothetical protein RLZZ46_1315 [Bacteroidota bacterium]
MRLFLILVLMPIVTNAQFYFNRTDTVPVLISGQALKLPFTGGENFLIVSEIDCNLDGQKDLFLFDRTGNKPSVFIHSGQANTSDYSFGFQYLNRFPKMQGWVLLRDYNCDGKEDIFTSTNAGIKIFKNTSSPTSGLQFELATTLLYAYFLDNPPSNYFNLYVTSVDIPAIYDADNDGDIDILTFDFAGSRLSYFENHSLDWYGNCDSLNAFVLTDECWGNFTENFNTNSVTLNDCRSSGDAMAETENSRHSGSCTLCADLNGDSLRDLVIGDISFNNMTFLQNGGTLQDANMVWQDSLFPNSSGTPVNLPLYPCAFYVDVNHDQVRDLLVSPNAGACSANNTSLWLYVNTGSDANANFVFQQNNFLQNEMIETGEGAYPVIVDIDQDGLKDLIIGNYGYLGNSCDYISKMMAFKNTGNNEDPEFTLLTRDFAGIGSLNIQNAIPTFGDLDGDLDFDMVVGDATGRLYYFTNTASTGTPPNYTLLSSSPLSGIDVGNFAAPQLVDLNRDGKLDLVVGEAGGNLNYFENTGTPSAAIFNTVPTNDSLGKVFVTPGFTITGYSHPCFFEFGGEFHLLVGSTTGSIFRYSDIDGNLNGAFNLVSSEFQGLALGSRSACAVSDLTSDGQPEMILGNFSGGVHFFMGDLLAGTNAALGYKSQLLLYPNPSEVGELSMQLKIKDFKGQHRIQIFDLGGRLLIDEERSASETHYLRTDLGSGCYLIVVVAEQARFSQKWIIR